MMTWRGRTSGTYLNDRRVLYTGGVLACSALPCPLLCHALTFIRTALLYTVRASGMTVTKNTIARFCDLSPDLWFWETVMP